MTRDAARLPHRRPHRVSPVTFPDAQILDVTGPLEVFSRAARWLRDEGRARELPYVVEILELARRRLEESELPVAAVARECGFGTEENMLRAFKRRLGVTPRDYRNRVR